MSKESFERGDPLWKRIIAGAGQGAVIAAGFLATQAVFERLFGQKDNDNRFLTEELVSSAGSIGAYASPPFAEAKGYNTIKGDRVVLLSASVAQALQLKQDHGPETRISDAYACKGINGLWTPPVLLEEQFSQLGPRKHGIALWDRNVTQAVLGVTVDNPADRERFVPLQTELVRVIAFDALVLEQPGLPIFDAYGPVN